MSERIVSVILGRNTPFDYTYSSGKNVSKMFSAIIDNYKSVDISIEKPTNNDDTINYWQLLFRNKFSDSIYDSGKYTAFAQADYDFNNYEMNKDIEESYAVITMRQLQLVLNQPYINFDTNRVFRLYQNFNLDKSQQEKLIFDATTRDIPISEVYRYTYANDNLHMYTNYTRDDINAIGSIAQTIEKMSLKQVNDMLNIIETRDKTQSINYYKNNRSKFAKMY